MTQINYLDCFATSPLGQFRFEARSPDNGTIEARDDRRLSPYPQSREAFGGFQSSFRYQLIENATDRVVWERRQGRRQESPGEVVVSDEGWTVTRTHGFAPTVVARMPIGRVAVHGDSEALRGKPESAKHEIRTIRKGQEGTGEARRGVCLLGLISTPLIYCCSWIRLRQSSSIGAAPRSRGRRGFSVSCWPRWGGCGLASSFSWQSWDS